MTEVGRTKPHLVLCAGAWCVIGAGSHGDDYWLLHELAVAWAVKRWKENRDAY